MTFYTPIHGSESHLLVVKALHLDYILSFSNLCLELPHFVALDAPVLCGRDLFCLRMDLDRCLSYLPVAQNGSSGFQFPRLAASVRFLRRSCQFLLFWLHSFPSGLFFVVYDIFFAELCRIYLAHPRKVVIV